MSSCQSSQDTSQPSLAVLSYRHAVAAPRTQTLIPQLPGQLSVDGSQLPFRNCLKGDPKLSPPLGQPKCSDEALRAAKAWAPCAKAGQLCTGPPAPGLPVGSAEILLQPHHIYFLPRTNLVPTSTRPQTSACIFSSQNMFPRTPNQESE